MPKTSTYYKVDKVAAGVEINRMTMIPNVYRNILLNIKSPLFPPMFFHKMSIGSLAIFIMSTVSLMTKEELALASSSSNLIKVD